MSGGTKSCGQCEHPNSIDAMFCSKCGARLPTREEAERAAKAAASATPKAPRRAAAKTMVGWQQETGDAPAPAPAGAPAEESAPSGPRRRIPNSSRTMLGMPAPDAQAVAEAVERAKASRGAGAAEQTHASADPGPGVNDGGETMPDPGPPANASAAVATVASAQNAADLRTPPGEPTPAPPPKRARDKGLGPTNRTMLGQAAPKIGLPVEESARGPESGRRSSAPPGPRGRAPVVYPSDPLDDEPLTLPRKSNKGLAVAALALGLVALVGGAIALVVTLLSASDVEASVVQGEDGEMLEIQVHGAEPGTKVRFRGAEQPLEAGVVRFPLSADDLALGDNELTVDVVAPDGAVESETIALHLEMRVRADLGALEQAPPAVDVVVEAPPGSEVTLDGEPLELDGRGRGTRRFPIDGSEASAEGVVEHVVRYRVVPPEGEAAQGELRTRIPLTTMQLDRPGARVVTEAEEIEVAGAVAPGSTVTVAGEAVEVNLGRFLTPHALPELGEHTIEVVARAPGKAPHIQRIEVRRVADLEAEAARYEVNEDLTYARIAQNPTTYRGQKVELTGVVYNVDVENGRSVIQVLVDACPDGERCPLWVTYPAATDAQLRDRVRVLGTVAGEQQFRSQRGEIRTVPRVDATFVLEESETRRRGR